MNEQTPEPGAGPTRREGETPIVPRVLVFFDYACQFCYLDWPRFKRLRAEHALELFLIPFELRPGLAAAGVSVRELGAGHSEHVEEHMRRMAGESGLDLVFPTFVPNTHLALVVGEVARDAGPEAHERVHEAILSAHSASADDIGDAQVLLRIAAEQGLDPAQVSAAFAQGTYDERIHQFRHFALEIGVTATPSALICNELLIGSRPYEVVAASLQRCLVDAGNVAEAVGAADADDGSDTSTRADGG